MYHRIFCSIVISMAPAIAMAVVSLTLAARSGPTLMGVVGLATAVAAPFLMATGANLRVLGVAGGRDVLSDSIRAQLRIPVWLTLLLLSLLWLTITDIRGRDLLVAIVVLGWRGGDIGWDEHALRHELANGPQSSWLSVVSRHSVLGLLVVLSAVASHPWPMLAVGAAILYWGSSAIVLYAGMQSRVAWTLLHTHPGVRRAIALSAASIAVAMGTLLLRSSLGAGGGNHDVGLYYSILGPLGLVGVVGSAAVLYGWRGSRSAWSPASRMAFGTVAGVLVALCLRLRWERVPPLVTSGSSFGLLWPILPEIAWSVGLLAAGTVVSALQQPLIVAGGREGTALRGEFFLLIGLGAAILLYPSPLRYVGALWITALWTAGRALWRTGVAW